jgi:hypothetical protein
MTSGKVESAVRCDIFTSDSEVNETALRLTFLKLSTLIVHHHVRISLRFSAYLCVLCVENAL